MAKKTNPIIHSNKLEKLDKFVAYATGDEEILSPEELQEFQILSLIDDQLRLARSWKAIQRVVEIKYNKQWSKPTVYRWISYTKYVFGTTRHIDKDFERSRAIDWFEKAIQWALKEKDYWFLGKQLKAYADLIGLNDKEIDENQKYEPSQYIMTVVNQIGKNTQINLANPKSFNAEDVRELAKVIQQGALPENLLDAQNLLPPEQPNTLDDE